MSKQEYDTSVIQLVDTLVQKAIKQLASDIHLEPTAQHLRVRYRIDGILYDQEPIGKQIMQQVLSRVKVLAHINIADRRIPHDGKFSVTTHRSPIDLRVSTFPSIFGEKIVIRILDRTKNAHILESLGFQTNVLSHFKDLLSRSSGFFLATGPTGSGKTTTLYAALSFLNAPHKNIITLEDPVEYTVEGVTQGQIHPDSGFTFEKGIRAVLRQDPDIAMIGEIRDKQTAQIAIEAALTGHVVLSTLHTNDATSVIMRLMDMGIEPFLINAAVSGVLAQRLARKICDTCKVAQAPDEHQLKFLSKLNTAIDTLYVGKGCDACMQVGYKGRTGIFELLAINNNMRSLIGKTPSFDAIHRQAVENGMHTLMADGLDKVRNGVISLAELMRVVV